MQTSRFDVANFDKDFTSKEPTLTPTEPAIIKAINQDEFVGFSFVNDDYKRPDVAPASGTNHHEVQSTTSAVCGSNAASSSNASRSPTETIVT